MYEGWSPTLVITDRETIKNVMVKDAERFLNRRVFPLADNDKVFAEMLSFIRDEKWKSLRSTMSPAFSSGKIKAMFGLIDEKVDVLIEEIEKEMDAQGWVNIQNSIKYFTTDVIASCAFGMESAVQVKKEESEFVKATRGLFNLESFGNFVKLFFNMFVPRLARALGLSFIGSDDYLERIVKMNAEQRQKSGVKRGDFLDLMLEALEGHVSKTKELVYRK